MDQFLVSYTLCIKGSGVRVRKKCITITLLIYPGVVAQSLEATDEERGYIVSRTVILVIVLVIVALVFRE